MTHQIENLVVVNGVAFMTFESDDYRAQVVVVPTGKVSDVIVTKVHKPSLQYHRDLQVWEKARFTSTADFYDTVQEALKRICF